MGRNKRKQGEPACLETRVEGRRPHLLGQPRRALAAALVREHYRNKGLESRV